MAALLLSMLQAMPSPPWVWQPQRGDASASCRLVKDTTAWTNRKDVLAADAAQCEQLQGSIAELAAEALQANCQTADADAATAEADLEAATAAVSPLLSTHHILELAGLQASPGLDAGCGTALEVDMPHLAPCMKLSCRVTSGQEEPCCI